MNKQKSTTTPSVTSTNSQPVDKYLIRFISKLEEDLDTGCLLYTRGALAPNGYGVYSVKGKSQLAHIYAYTTYHDTSVPEGKVLGHSSECLGRRHCCNPLHLRPITPRENSAQRRVDGTMDVPRRKYVRATTAEVADIRERAERGESLYSIAQRWQRSQPYIKRVVSKAIHNPANSPRKKGPKQSGAVAKMREAA